MHDLNIRDCGLAPYGEMLNLQKKLVAERQEKRTVNTVLLVEHPAVITMGARNDLNELRVDRDRLSADGIEIVSIRRGGGSTAHNPGQVVLYPILDLRSLGIDIREYIRQLEEIGIALLGQLDVKARRREKLVGLWSGEKKIGSIGVHVKKWVTYHGMAINIQNDLSIFDKIVPCGLCDVDITSVLKETGKNCSMVDVKMKLTRLCEKFWR